MATSDEYAQWIVNNADKKGSPEFDIVAKAYADSSNNTPTPAPQSADKSSFLDEVKGGIASGPINAYLGIKSMLPGGMSDIDKNVLQQNNEAAKNAPVSAIAGNLAMLAPTAFIPGANTLTGASTIGAITGLINPADNIKDRVTNTAIGGISGLGGQILGNKVGNMLTSKLANSNEATSTINALNGPKNDILQAGQALGYKLPISEVNPGFINNRLEGLAGKAAIKQEAALHNQQVTNNAARNYLGLSNDTPITKNALDDIRSEAGKVYQEVGGLSTIAKQDLEALKQARNDAQGWYNAYNRSASPADLIKAKEAKSLSEMLDSSLVAEAKQAGREDLIPALKEARVKIAKTYTIQRALNDTGDVSAPVIGRLVGKGKPLSDELKTVGQFNNAFPKFTGEGVKTPAPGVSKVEALSAALLAGGGSYYTDSPTGALAGGLAFLSSPTRAALLSKTAQKMFAKIPEASTSTKLKLAQALLNNRIAKGATPALSAQAVLGSAPSFE